MYTFSLAASPTAVASFYYLLHMQQFILTVANPGLFSFPIRSLVVFEVLGVALNKHLVSGPVLSGQPLTSSSVGFICLIEIKQILLAD